jgi:hypothetical protein
MLYALKVWALKQPRINRWFRSLQAARGRRVGDYGHLTWHVQRFAPGRSFADIGCLWGVDGKFAFIAEAAGATRVTGVDVYGPTEEFEREREARHSRVRFILGDVSQPDVAAAIGETDVVLCAGVLYHHPSPIDLLVALRAICGSTLILRTSTIPEVDGLPNAAVFYPHLPEHARARWNLSSLGVTHQAGITDAYDSAQGYGNWFWGLTPSCLRSMLQVSGFTVEEDWPEPFAHTMICTPVAVPGFAGLDDVVPAVRSVEVPADHLAVTDLDGRTNVPGK